MDLEKDLEWKDVRTDGIPKEGEKIVVDTRAMYTGHVEMSNGLPPKIKWVFDKNQILNDTRYAYVSHHDMNKIEKEYW